VSTAATTAAATANGLGTPSTSACTPSDTTSSSAAMPQTSAAAQRLNLMLMRCRWMKSRR
jgi:hypothetical protein